MSHPITSIHPLFQWLPLQCTRLRNVHLDRPVFLLWLWSQQERLEEDPTSTSGGDVASARLSDLYKHLDWFSFEIGIQYERNRCNRNFVWASPLWIFLHHMRSTAHSFVQSKAHKRLKNSTVVPYCKVFNLLIDRYAKTWRDCQCRGA